LIFNIGYWLLNIFPFPIDLFPFSFCALCAYVVQYCPSTPG
jgi:hypothetical protein